jgi:hypothetical protein
MNMYMSCINHVKHLIVFFFCSSSVSFFSFLNYFLYLLLKCLDDYLIGRMSTMIVPTFRLVSFLEFWCVLLIAFRLSIFSCLNYFRDESLIITGHFYLLTKKNRLKLTVFLRYRLSVPEQLCLHPLNCVNSMRNHRLVSIVISNLQRIYSSYVSSFELIQSVCPSLASVWSL